MYFHFRHWVVTMHFLGHLAETRSLRRLSRLRPPSFQRSHLNGPELPVRSRQARAICKQSAHNCMHLWALMQEPSPEVHGLALIIGLLEVASELSKVPVSMRIDWNRQCSDKIPIAFWIHHRLDQSWSMLLVWPGSGWGAWGVCHVINMHQNPPELHNTTPPELHNANTELSLRCAPPEFEALPADPHPMLASAPTLRPASNSLSAGVTLVVIVLR